MSRSSAGANMLSRRENSKVSSLWRNWVPKCGNASCSTKSLLRALTHGHRGMKIEDDWYCGAACFEQVIKSQLEELMTSQGKPKKTHSSRVPLGLLLLSRGVLTSEQLRLALDHQRLTELDFGTAAKQLGFATEEEVTAAVAAQWACPVFSLGDRPLEVQMRIPRHLLDLYEMLPVHYSANDRRLMVGFVRGVQYQVLYAIEHITSCTVVPCFITSREYQFHLTSLPRPSPDDRELVSDPIVDSAEMARVTTHYVVRLAAERVRLGKCRDYLWARIWGREQELDLLFRVQAD